MRDHSKVSRSLTQAIRRDGSIVISIKEEGNTALPAYKACQLTEIFRKALTRTWDRVHQDGA